MHAYTSYGHHIFSTNFYVPLTVIGGSSSLFCESFPGREDWKPIVGQYGTTVKMFPGALNIHWTTENMTNKTRASIDFRLIPGPLFHAIKPSPNFQDGYYACCKFDTENEIWKRAGTNTLTPDHRMGWPWQKKPR